MKKAKILSHKNNYILCDDDLKINDILTFGKIKLKVIENSSPVYKIQVLNNPDNSIKFTNIEFSVK